MTAVAPQPASVDTLARIYDLFLAAERDLNRRLDDVLTRGPEWYRESARLRGLQREVEARMSDIRFALDERSLGQGLGEVYGFGASDIEGVVGERFGWSSAHLGAVDRLAHDTFEDLLTATRYVETSAKATIRQAARLATRFKVVGGQTAIQAGNELARTLRSSGIGVVTYRNGARHGVGEYARMVMRTKSAVAYNVGGLNHSAAAGVKLFEIVDGHDCGLTFHLDGTLANGLVVDGETAAAYPIAHPNCRRVFVPRPDLSPKEVQSGVTRRPSTTAAQRADQAAYEKFLAEQTARRAGRRARRAPRQRREPRTPRSPRATPRPTPEPAPAPVPEPEPRKPTPRRRPAPEVPKPTVIADDVQAQRETLTAAASPTRGPAPGTIRVGDTFDYLDDSAARYKSIADEIDKLHGALPTDDRMMARLRVAWERETDSGPGGYFGARVPVSGRLKRPSKGRRRKGRTLDERVRESAQWRAEDAAWAAEERAPRIMVASKSVKGAPDGRSKFAFAHEIGHRIDYLNVTHRGTMQYASGTRAALPTVEREALDAFIDAAKGSDAMLKLRAATVQDFRYYNYVTSAEETWARAYSQWVARESADPDMRAGLRAWRGDDTDRGPIGFQWSDEEFDRVIAPAVEKVLRARGLMS